MKEIKVNLTYNPYIVYIGGQFTKSALHLTAQKGQKALIITDENVNKLYTAKLESAIDEAGYFAVTKVIPAGEKYKNMDTVKIMYEECLAHNMDRGSIIIALGGGVVGDMAGFTASIYLRGIPFIQIPTTLLAQVDAGIGGKTGIDLPQGKNLIGTFYQPKFVWIDPNVLTTLDDKEYINGLAEVIKYGIIKDEKLFDYLKENVKDVLEKNTNALEYILSACVKIKADVVAKDEKEQGLRRILNFGHTLGHALEAQEGYTARHGECVAVGMSFAAFVSHKTGICDGEILDKIDEILVDYGFKDVIIKYKELLGSGGKKADDVIKIMKNDKKMDQGKVNYVLPVKIGGVVVKELILDDLEKILHDWGKL
ncbi:MAG: 3-dehydroquinate synthase [Elusimicrobiota bacterium]